MIIPVLDYTKERVMKEYFSFKTSSLKFNYKLSEDFKWKAKKEKSTKSLQSLWIIEINKQKISIFFTTLNFVSLFFVFSFPFMFKDYSKNSKYTLEIYRISFY